MRGRRLGLESWFGLVFAGFAVIMAWWGGIRYLCEKVEQPSYRRGMGLDGESGKQSGTRRRRRTERPPEIGEQVLAANETSTRVEHFRLLKCRYCGERQLKRLHRTFWRRCLWWLLLIAPYRCRQCGTEQARLVGARQMLLPALMVLSVAGAFALGVRSYQREAQGLSDRVNAENHARLAETAAKAISMGKAGETPTPGTGEQSRVLRNQDIISLLRTVPDRKVLLQRIVDSGAAYDLSVSAIERLKQAGVDEEVLSLMNLRMAQVAAQGDGSLK